MSDPPGVHAPGLKWALNGRIRVLRPLDEQHSELGVSPLQVSSPGIFRHARQRRRRFPTPQSSAAESSLCGRSMTSPTSRRGLTKLSQPGGVVLVGVQVFARSAAHAGTEQQTQRIPDRPVHVSRVYRLVRDVAAPNQQPPRATGVLPPAQLADLRSRPRVERSRAEPATLLT